MKIMGFFFSLLLITSMGFADPASSNTSANGDQEIIATLIALNNNEISVAELVPNKTSNKKVEHYAQLMKKQHTKNLTKTISLSRSQHIEPVDNQKTADLKKQGKQELSSLTSLAHGEFDKAYINDMVTDHENALTTLNGCLKQVNNPKLKKHLLTTIDHVKHHLAKAKQIQQQLS